MNTKLIKAVEQLGKQHGKADYILGETYQYLIRNTPTHPEGIEFFDWFIRNFRKYRDIGDGKDKKTLEFSARHKTAFNKVAQLSIQKGDK